MTARLGLSQSTCVLGRGGTPRKCPPRQPPGRPGSVLSSCVTQTTRFTTRNSRSVCGVSKCSCLWPRSPRKAKGVGTLWTWTTGHVQ